MRGLFLNKLTFPPIRRPKARISISVRAFMLHQQCLEEAGVFAWEWRKLTRFHNSANFFSGRCRTCWILWWKRSFTLFYTSEVAWEQIFSHMCSDTVSDCPHILLSPCGQWPTRRTVIQWGRNLLAWRINLLSLRVCNSKRILASIPNIFSEIS